MFASRYLNQFQKFGLVYWLRLQRRIHNEDIHSAQELMTYELFPDRWREIHLGINDADVEIIDGEVYRSPTEIDENKLDAFLARIENQAQGEMTGAEAGPWQDAQEAWRFAP